MNFSVIIPTRDRAEILIRAIDSVLAQDSGDFELIVVDDGSTDDTSQRVAERAADPRLRLIQQPRMGAAVARNTGAEAAGGRFLLFLDSDDELTTDALSIFDRLLSDTPTAAVACTSADEFLHDGSFRRHLAPRTLGPAYHYQSGQFLAGTFVVARDVFEAVGRFASACRSSQHSELALRLADHCQESGREMITADQTTVRIHAHSGSHLRDDPQRLLDGAEFILREHHARLGRSPRQLADWHTVAGVYSTRLSRPANARRHFARAWWVHPVRPRRLARWLISCVPALARRLWIPQTVATSSDGDPSVD